MVKLNTRIVFGLLLSGAALQAAIIEESAILTGPAENPPTTSTGTGTALVTIDTVLNTLHVQVTFTGLTSGTTASHIHCCIAPPGATGVATTTPTFTGFPLGVTSGTFDSILDLTMASSYNPAFITAEGGTIAGAEAALIAGIAGDMAYLNIHTTNNPGGEIRGFLVPEPTTMLLMGAGLSALLLARRRRV